MLKLSAKLTRFEAAQNTKSGVLDDEGGGKWEQIVLCIIRCVLLRLWHNMYPDPFSFKNTIQFVRWWSAPHEEHRHVNADTQQQTEHNANEV